MTQTGKNRAKETVLEFWEPAERKAFSCSVDLDLRRGRPRTVSCAKAQAFWENQPTEKKTDVEKEWVAFYNIA